MKRRRTAGATDDATRRIRCRPAPIKISPERQQLIGVKFATVELAGDTRVDPHRRQGHLRRDACRARPHAHRGLDREGLRRLHRRRRQAGRADADDLQPGDAGVAAGTAAGRRARDLMRGNPLASAAEHGESLFEAAKRRLRAVAAQRGPDPAGAHHRGADPQHHAVARRPAASSPSGTRFRIRRSRPTATCTRSPTSAASGSWRTCSSRTSRRSGWATAAYVDVSQRRRAVDRGQGELHPAAGGSHDADAQGPARREQSGPAHEARHVRERRVRRRERQAARRARPRRCSTRAIGRPSSSTSGTGISSRGRSSSASASATASRSRAGCRPASASCRPARSSSTRRASSRRGRRHGRPSTSRAPRTRRRRRPGRTAWSTAMINAIIEFSAQEPLPRLPARRGRGRRPACGR